jgi:hypothetical protein
MMNRFFSDVPRLSSIVLMVLGLGCSSMLWAGTAVQPGVYYHEPTGIGLRLDAIRSGEFCISGSERGTVCTADARVVITGQERCEYPPGTENPCTHFGYEFNYRAAQPGSEIRCTRTRQDPTGRRDVKDYSHTLETATGRISYPTFRIFTPVEQQTILSEVHECSYQGENLATIKYVIYYEPDRTDVPNPAASGNERRTFEEVPHACSAPYLTEQRAQNVLGELRVQSNAANEHVPQLQSQCIRSTRPAPARQVAYLYKFMLSDQFDVRRIDPMQVQFNASFAAGGTPPQQVREDIGDRAFVFEKGNRSTLLVITGIKGPEDGADRGREFIATYSLDHRQRSHEERTATLIELALEDQAHWATNPP